MGLDTIIVARGDLTVNKASIWSGSVVKDNEALWRDGAIVCSDGEAFFSTIERYYGPAYARGDWPIIYGAIRRLQAVFPAATVYYADDHNEGEHPGYECTPEYLAKMWDYYLEKGHADYYD